MSDEKRFLSSIPWFVQFVVLLGIVGLIWSGLHFLMFAKTREETAMNEAKVEQLKRENDANQIVVGNLAQFEASLQASRQELEELKDLLPEAVQLSNIMQTIQTKAKNRGLTLRVFRPRDAITRDYYTEKPITLDVSGSYNNLGMFFADLANYERINSVGNFEVVQTEMQTEKVSVTSGFTLTIYYVSPDNLANLQNKGKAKKDDKAPANGAAPATPPAAPKQ
jgi:type IV pilus assembly protein PilO